MTVTPEIQAELRRLLDVNRERDFHALPWHAWDRGIGYELHVGATCRDEMEPRGYCEEVNNGFRKTFCAPEAELIAAAVNALPALLDAAAERDALAADADKWQRAALTLQGEREHAVDPRAELLAEELHKLVADFQANGNSRELGDPTAPAWFEAARQVLDAIAGWTDTAGSES